LLFMNYTAMNHDDRYTNKHNLSLCIIVIPAASLSMMLLTTFVKQEGAMPHTTILLWLCKALLYPQETKPYSLSLPQLLPLLVQFSLTVYHCFAQNFSIVLHQLSQIQYPKILTLPYSSHMTPCVLRTALLTTS
jgi:hypothetical protein